MEKFSIARDIRLYHMMDYANYEETKYLRVEPNGNIFWTIHPELATQFEHANAEFWLKSQGTLMQSCYLVPASKTDA